MVELKRSPVSGKAQYEANFSGDVANFCVYLKRLNQSASVKFLSATGDDAISEKMRAFFSDEEIDTGLIARSQNKTVGLYMINTDDTGERSFTYWRSDSAAKDMLQLAGSSALTQAVDNTQYFYFSGITLAILNDGNREKLFDLLELCRNRGKTIIFDPNYRPKLWPNHEQAAMQTERAYRLCDILLSSCEDEQLLWGAATSENILARLATYDIKEIIVTNGADETVGFAENRKLAVQPKKAKKVVDTTSAGDAFNAAYLAARHAGLSAEASVENASTLASVVIGLPGAIIPKDEMPTP